MTPSSLRELVPPTARRTLKEGVRQGARATSRFRLWPSFVIIGGQRCGTTSLYRYLAQHPQVAPVILEKGAHYFSTNYDKGVAWYRAHFVTEATRRLQRSRMGKDVITGEASPYYLYHPLAPGRMHELLPGVKLIVMLRDPVKRAFSSHRHMVERGLDTLSFEEAIAAEPKRLEGERERLMSDPSYYSFEHQHHAYATRGLYADYLAVWRSLFSPEQMLVVQSEAFFRATDDEYRRVTRFLGLEDHSLRSYEAHNPTQKEKARISPEMQAQLVERFREPNERLFEMLGTRVDWLR
jgi:hypothetical protein